jgi:hypothetical protein
MKTSAAPQKIYQGDGWPRPTPTVQRPAADEKPWLAIVNSWIGEHPALSLGAALVVGVTLGWLIKRR